MTKPVCVITGVGDGTGAALARRFARDRYQVAMIARNRDRLAALQREIADARAFECDIGDLDVLILDQFDYCLAIRHVVFNYQHPFYIVGT